MMQFPAASLKQPPARTMPLAKVEVPEVVLRLVAATGPEVNDEVAELVMERLPVEEMMPPVMVRPFEEERPLAATPPEKVEVPMPRE